VEPLLIANHSYQIKGREQANWPTGLQPCQVVAARKVSGKGWTQLRHTGYLCYQTRPRIEGSGFHSHLRSQQLKPLSLQFLLVIVLSLHHSNANEYQFCFLSLSFDADASLLSRNFLWHPERDAKLRSTGYAQSLVPAHSGRKSLQRPDGIRYLLAPPWATAPLQPGAVQWRFQPQALPGCSSALSRSLPVELSIKFSARCIY